MEIFGAISSGEHWRSNDLNMIYPSDIGHDDHNGYHQFIMTSHCDVPSYDLNHIGTSSTLEMPFTVWPSCDSMIVHDVPSAHFGCSEDGSSDMFLNVGCDENHDWMNVNGHSQARHINAELKIEIPRQTCIDELKTLQGNSKKRARSTMAIDDQGSKSRKNVKARKSTPKIGPRDDNEEGDNVGPISPNSPLSPGELSNASQEEFGGSLSTPSPKEAAVVLNLNGKARASRGSATDPQSVYARKRREKINERLKTLQTLVPNGTKVDISTMLEEAVQYVRFLQLQIKLLSSDDLWMYAPLAYNGMDLGDLGFNSPRL